MRSSIRQVLLESSLEGQKQGLGKKRNFVETIEVQIGLKVSNFCSCCDPERELTVRPTTPSVTSVSRVPSSCPTFPVPACSSAFSPTPWTLTVLSSSTRSSPS